MGEESSPVPPPNQKSVAEPLLLRQAPQENCQPVRLHASPRSNPTGSRTVMGFLALWSTKNKIQCEVTPVKTLTIQPQWM